MEQKKTNWLPAIIVLAIVFVLGCFMCGKSTPAAEPVQGEGEGETDAGVEASMGEGEGELAPVIEVTDGQ